MGVDEAGEEEAILGGGYDGDFFVEFGKGVGGAVDGPVGFFDGAVAVGGGDEDGACAD